ncbi:MAG: phytanoyl-CoA dioxygenase family protein [Woeseiaceae bacterium]|nr:phytanoyl-CoA dioxygenase family protein [Woeseiaceae bacterium]
MRSRLATDGFVCLPGLCSNEFLQHMLDVSHRRIHEVTAALGNREIGIGSAVGYDEIVQRSPGRWDIPITPEQFGLRVTELPWWPLVADALGEDAEHSFSGIVSSEPGCPAQHWHIDSPHIDADHRRPHAVNAMIALHDIPMEMGPTEIAVGSHILSNHLRNPDLVEDELVYQHAGTSPGTLVEGTGEAAPACWAETLPAGSCLLFDDRILHRGLANDSDRTRYIGYFSYREKAYTENTHFEAQRSVFDLAARSSAG